MMHRRQKGKHGYRKKTKNMANPETRKQQDQLTKMKINKVEKERDRRTQT